MKSGQFDRLVNQLCSLPGKTSRVEFKKDNANPINDVGAIGRLSATPDANWLETVDGMFAVQYSRGLAANDPAMEILRSLAGLKLRDLLLAILMHRGQAAYDRLAARLRRFDAPPFQVVGAA